MKRILMLIVLSVSLCSCFTSNPRKCTEYTGPNECIKFPDGSEEIRGPR